MNLLRLLRRESPVALEPIAAMAALSGLVNALLLSVINAAAGSPGDEGNLRLFLMFCVIATLFVMAQNYILTRSILAVEGVLNGIRQRLSDRIREADLAPLENVGHSAIYNSVSTQITTISSATSTIIIAVQAGVMIFFTFMYLAVLSRTAFWLTMAIAAAALFIHMREVSELQRANAEAVRREHGFFDLLRGLLTGFKEVKMNRARGDDLLAHMRRSSQELAQLKIDTGTRFSRHFIFTQTIFYILIGAIVFALPRLNWMEAPVVTKAAATILFIVGPLSNLVGSLPVISAADVAVSSVEEIETMLSLAQSRVPETAAAPAVGSDSFATLELSRLTYHFMDKEGTPVFTVGPLDLTIARGEVLFLIGGNGSGKSTLLKLITALYHPFSGEIVWDGKPVTAARANAYRSLFSPIFSDYYVFKRMYGLYDADPERISKLLNMLQIEDKTGVVESELTTTDLSTGQRKRIALLVNYLEDRPIQLFDEWAADQDPGFRRFFYETLIPEMRAAGKTVIAATHDDRYFHVADRVMKMENGRFVPYGGDVHA